MASTIQSVISGRPVKLFLATASVLCLFAFWSAILSSMWTFEADLSEETFSEGGEQVCHVLVISTYPPRRCGIGVFAKNFIEAMQATGTEFSRRTGANRHCEYSVIAFDDPDSTAAYNASTVLGIINLDADVPSRAFWNASQYVLEHQKRTMKNLKAPDVLSIPKKDLPFTHMVLQLEFGLIKIKWQALDLVRWMTGGLDAIPGMPHLHTSIVLHSPYAYPNLEERGFVRHMSYFSDAWIVMSWHAYHSVVSAYGVDKSIVFMIPHAVRKPKGIPQAETVRNIDGVQLADARQGGLSLDQLDNLLALPKDDPRRPLLIFNNGLIHVHKGYDRVIRNLKAMMELVPDKPIVVLITGRETETNEEKDIMKKHLQFAAKLGVAQHIIWQDEYVDSEEVDRRLYGSDVYMTPYDEITPTSGALLEAMAHGCAIISTAYRHATEVLSSDRGVIVPFEDDSAIAAGFAKLLKSREVREQYGVRAKAFVRNWTGEKVALQYHALLAKLEINAAESLGKGLVLQTPGAAYVEEMLLPMTPDPFYLDPAFDSHLYPPRDRDDSELAIITPENNYVNSFRPSSAHWSEKHVTTFNGLTLFSEQKLKEYEGGVLPKDLRMAPGVYVLFADKDIQVNGKIASRSETGYLLSRVGVRWGYTWILADITMGLDVEHFDPDVSNRIDLSEFVQIDRLEPEPGTEGAGWRERVVLRARQVWVTIVVHMHKEVTVTLSQPDRFSHPLGLLGQTVRCHWDRPLIDGECKRMFFGDIKSLKPDQWKMSMLEGNNIFSTAAKGQVWQMFGIRLNAFELDEEMMTGTLFDYYDTSATKTVLKFRLEGPVLDNCGFAMVNRQLWFGLSIRQQLRHNWRSALPNPYNKNFEIEVEVIPSEDTVSVEQYEKAASPGTVLHMLIYTAYKKQLGRPEQVSSPVVSVFRNHWPPKFQYPNESLLADVAAGNKIVWIHQQPWEFYGIPKTWTEWFVNSVDALWVPSRHCEVGYVGNGIPAGKIDVVRHGVSYQKIQAVNPGMASGGALALPEMAKPLQSKTFKFLFIGGALPRKGIDLLLRAFVETFSTFDDVSLIVHSIYGDEFKTNVMEAMETQYDKYPEIVFLKQELTWVDMELLYRSVDVYVCPYRNEGFGLTIVEAMANGLPIIITRGGPALEICEDDHTFWVEAEWTACKDVKPCEANGTMIFGQELTVQAAWFEPSLASLSSAFRNAYRTSVPELRKMSDAARRRASELSWEPVYTELENTLARYTIGVDALTVS